MNDLRRTLLWSVFAVSLLMLWDGWLRHTGQPSLFAPAPAASEVAQAASAGASGASGANNLPQASATLAGGGAPVPVAGASAPAVPVKGERITLQTDVVKATIDTLGGNVVKVELLQHRSQDLPEQNMVILDHTATHTYEAQSGLVAQTASDGALPNHRTLFVPTTTERTLAEGAQALVFTLLKAVFTSLMCSAHHGHEEHGHDHH